MVSFRVLQDNLRLTLMRCSFVHAACDTLCRQNQPILLVCSCLNLLSKEISRHVKRACIPILGWVNRRQLGKLCMHAIWSQSISITLTEPLSTIETNLGSMCEDLNEMSKLIDKSPSRGPARNPSLETIGLFFALHQLDSPAKQS